ncbi:MAG: cation diffusion facilitator family transporter [Paracoccaceae bacterium]
MGGVIIARIAGLWWLDPLLALFVAGNIIWAGWSVLKESAGGLMDEAPARQDIDAIHRAISAAGQGAVLAHDLRARRAGNTTFIEFHLIVPGQMTVTVSHDICDRIEQALIAEFGFVETVIHAEPEGHAKAEAIVLNHSTDAF